MASRPSCWVMPASARQSARPRAAGGQPQPGADGGQPLVHRQDRGARLVVQAGHRAQVEDHGADRAAAVQHPADDRVGQPAALAALQRGGHGQAGELRAGLPPGGPGLEPAGDDRGGPRCPLAQPAARCLRREQRHDVRTAHLSGPPGPMSHTQRPPARIRYWLGVADIQPRRARAATHHPDRANTRRSIHAQRTGRVDQFDVRGRQWMVAREPPAQRVVALGQQPDVVAQAEHGA